MLQNERFLNERNQGRFPLYLIFELAIVHLHDFGATVQTLHLCKKLNAAYCMLEPSSEVGVIFSTTSITNTVC